MTEPSRTSTQILTELQQTIIQAAQELADQADRIHAHPQDLHAAAATLKKVSSLLWDSLPLGTMADTKWSVTEHAGLLAIFRPVDGGKPQLVRMLAKAFDSKHPYIHCQQAEGGQFIASTDRLVPLPNTQLDLTPQGMGELSKAWARRLSTARTAAW